MAIQDEIIETEFLVLRKTPYAETSLIVAGISPDAGRLHFLIRGARRLGKKQFPTVDLFRVLAVQYRAPRGELAVLRSANILEDFREVGTDPGAYALAAWLARLALSNTHNRDPVPNFFAVLRGALRLMVREQERGERVGPVFGRVIAATTLLALLGDHGLLPAPATVREAKRRERLLAALREDGTLPDITGVRSKALLEWARNMAHYADLVFPDWPRSLA